MFSAIKTFIFVFAFLGYLAFALPEAVEAAGGLSEAVDASPLGDVPVLHASADAIRSGTQTANTAIIGDVSSQPPDLEQFVLDFASSFKYVFNQGIKAIKSVI